MGVPSFFKWLAKRYPKTLQEASERQPGEMEPETASGSSSAALPTFVPQPVANNPVIDNLYLDMNGIIHPVRATHDTGAADAVTQCCHPEEGGVLTEPEMLARIWLYIQRLVAIARPRKVLYLAIDGVAPRAKMNQQRARRFRAAQETQQKAEVYSKLKKEWLARGLKLPKHMAGPDPDPSSEFDRNVITPGTPFMAKVAASLHFHVEWALHNDPAWKHLTVLFSSAQVPGEGEHKIINWIRAQRVADPDNYDPNTRHCLYGMDADLIMLGLATHERYFYIIRESLGDMSTYNPAANVTCEICGEKGHFLDKCTGEKWTRKAAPAEGSAEADLQRAMEAASPDSAAAIKQLIPETKTTVQAFQFLNLPILREYLTREFKLPVHHMASLQFPWDFENVIDDFILLCMFVGNDFLPHLPSLDIKEGALEMLIKAYKELLPTQLGGYLSTAGVINLPRLGLLLQAVGTKENDIFARRRNRAQYIARKDQDHKRKIMGIRNDNARREREQNQFGIHQYNADGTPKAPSSTLLSVNTNNMGSVLPSSKPFIHPSRGDPSANVSTPLSSPAGPSAPPSTPVTEVDKITAAKANLSAAALLRAKLLGSKAAAASAASSAAAAAPAPAATASPSSASGADAATVGNGNMDTSSIPPSTRQQSDPIPASTAALSALSTSDEDDTAARANARAAQLLGQTMLGKRKSKDESAAPEGATAAAAAAASATSGDSTMSEAPASAASASTPTASASSDPVPVPSHSPALELPLKKAKSESETSTSAPVPSPSASPSDFSSSPSASPPASSSTLNPSASFDPQETDQFGNLVRDMDFGDYFAQKWNAINQPADVVDAVQFGVDGWKQRYYRLKLHIDIDEAMRDPGSAEGQKAARVFRSYIEGLCWVMRYYFHGPASWSWFFIDHYAPMAEDLAAFLLRDGSMPPEKELFVKGMPFEPVGQLLAVLPAPSSHCVPRAAAALMTDDPSSPLHSFYPRDFENDMNGKKFAHQAVALLPFIDEKLLLRELARVRPQFDAEETARNSLGCEYVYVHASSPAGQQIYKHVYEGSLGLRGEELSNIRYLTPAALQATTAIPFDTVATKGLSGQLRAYVTASLPSHPSILTSIEPDAPRPIQRLEVISAQYDLPPYKPHVCRMLPNADPVVPQLDEADFRTLTEPRVHQTQQQRRLNNQAQVPGGVGGWQQAQQPMMRGPYPAGPPMAYPGLHPAAQQFIPMPMNGPGGGYYTHMPMFMGGMPLHPHQQMMPQAHMGYYPPMQGMAPMQGMQGMAPQGMQPQQGYYPPMQPMQGMMMQGAPGQQPPMPQQPQPQQMAAAPYNPALQTFLQAPPPPGHAAGYIPPPMAQMVPGFPLPGQQAQPMDMTGAPMGGMMPMQLPPPPPPQV